MAAIPMDKDSQGNVLRTHADVTNSKFTIRPVSNTSGYGQNSEPAKRRLNRAERRGLAKKMRKK